MTLYWGFLAGALSLCVSALTMILFGRQRRSAIREIGEIREKWSEEMRKYDIAFSDRIAEMKRDIRTLEMSMQNSPDLLRDGRLSRSGRAQAMNLLRSGVSPDTASATLGVAKREMRLLGRISEMLSVR